MKKYFKNSLTFIMKHILKKLQKLFNILIQQQLRVQGPSFKSIKDEMNDNSIMKFKLFKKLNINIMKSYKLSKKKQK